MGACNEKSILYPKRSRLRVFKNADLGRREREDYKQCRKCEKCSNGKPRTLALHFAVVKGYCLAGVGNCSGDEEDGNIYPIGRFSYNAVIGVKQNGN